MISTAALVHINLKITEAPCKRIARMHMPCFARAHIIRAHETDRTLSQQLMDLVGFIDGPTDWPSTRDLTGKHLVIRG